MVIFVYGSLAQGHSQFSKIESFIESIEEAFVKGALFRNKIGMPVLALEGIDQVPGQLVRMKDSALLLPILDQFFGFNEQIPSRSENLRECVLVQSKNGLERAWIYVLNPERRPTGLVYIPNGDWKSLMSQKESLVDKISEKQKNYIVKLGASSGRDIVPIDLGLYRELMSLELIVDKGRRLALSKVGQELYKYLS